ncbi:MAG: phosphotransferase family protein [Gammaproteobacteria bacterium]|nr:MAG: phosphotransferase family protein [Gammaproteobacteria bacterium]
MPCNDDPELMEPRRGEELVLERLEPYLRERLPATVGEFTVRQFQGGHANLTYRVRFGDSEYVLRRPPLGPLAPGSHDMQREFRVLSKLYRQFPLAPRSHLYCADESIIGAPFQIMDRRHGIVIRNRMPAMEADGPELRHRIGEMLVDVLASLHGVDRGAAGLGRLGHPAGFVERQLRGWSGRWQAAAHENNAEMAKLIAWLERRQPATQHVSLLHNDYKLDNMLVDARDPAIPVAILDWDMCTSGDALMDLGYLLNQWVEPDDDPAWIEWAAMPTWQPGFARREEVIERYCKRSGFDVDDIQWYYAFSVMKFAVIIQQIYIRYRRGQTVDNRFAHYDQRAASFVSKGCRIAEI